MVEASSTNDLARALAERGAPHGSWVVADHQTAGRGRLGRRWELTEGGVALSVVVRPRLPLSQVPLLCLAAAVVVAGLHPALRIKWPNDVLLPDGRKVSGILAELEFQAGAPAVILGVGVNLGVAPALPTAGCLAELPAAPLDRDEVAEALVTGILQWTAELETEGPGALVSAWEARSATTGARVRIGEVEGWARGIDPEGTLWVEGDDGVRVAVRAGDVELVRHRHRS